jgi:hypothetical protein
MAYKIDTTYCWYELDNEYVIVKMYFINHCPFTFDELSSIVRQDPEIISIADKNLKFCPEDLYKSSFYLIDEQVHPCLFTVDLENPEELPND